jgi:ketosteroid isomerase-like protein
MNRKQKGIERFIPYIATVLLALGLILLGSQNGDEKKVVAASLQPTQVAEQKLIAQDEQFVRQALQEWRQLYSYGERPFSFNGYEHLYINTDELLAYDNVAPRDTQIDGWKTYRSIWEPVINANFTGQEITRFEIQRVAVSGDLAWSAITFWFRAKNQGKPFYSSQHGTHIWRKVNGKWRIVHEHMTAPVKVNGKEIIPQR